MRRYEQIKNMILDVFNQEPLPADHIFYKYDNLDDYTACF